MVFRVVEQSKNYYDIYISVFQTKIKYIIYGAHKQKNIAENFSKIFKVLLQEHNLFILPMPTP